MRIAIVGSCQVHAIGDAFRILLEGADIVSLEIARYKSAEALARADEMLQQCDHIFAHHLGNNLGSFSTANLRSRFPSLVMMPTIVFTGFHPDSLYFFLEKKQYASPVGQLHSAIIAAAFAMNLSADRTAALFNAFIFRRLGYFDEFAKASRFLREAVLATGLDIEQEWPSWILNEAFMHTINHPKARVLASLARLLAVREGLVAPDRPTPHLPYDHLSNGTVWPVYPEIAAAVGVAGTYHFKRAGSLNPLLSRGLLITLPEFIVESFALYAGYPAALFELPQIASTRSLLARMIR